MTAIQRAVALKASAREHKRLSAYHRREAQKTMAELERFCREYGIELEIIREERTDIHGESPTRSIH